MADVSRFRSALNGFNRADVVNYIESMSIEHQKQLRQRQEKIEALCAEKQTLEEKLGELETALTTEQQARAATEEALRAAQALAEQPPEETQQPVEPDDELAAYRRAAEMERTAVARAKKLQLQLSALCMDARTQYQDAGEELSTLALDVSAGIERMQDVLTELALIFERAEAGFEALDLPEFSEET